MYEINKTKFEIIEITFFSGKIAVYNKESVVQTYKQNCTGPVPLAHGE